MKTKPIALLLLLSLLCSCLGLCACRKPAEKFSKHSFEYFDTVTTVTGYAESQAEFDRVAEKILSALGEYHRLFTIYHRYEGQENLCTVNELVNGQHRTVTVDPRIVDLLLYAKEMYTLTNGRINVAMGSVLSIWHDYRTVGMNDPASAQLPPMDKLLAAAEHTDIEALVIDPAASTVTLTDPKMKLDVGAIAKGYAVEMIAQDLERDGITGYVLNVGGNVRTVGGKPDGTGWTVGIEDPLDGDGFLSYLSMTDESLVTSGAYQRYYLVNGKRYHHIIHPDTLMPSDRFLSVSVLTPHSGQGDALSTALFCMSPEEGLALVESLPDTEAQWVFPDGTRQASSGWNARTTDP